MDKNKLLIELEGAVEDGGNVRLNDFIEELKAIKETLVGIDHSITKAHSQTIDFRIVDLKKGSAELTIEAIPRKAELDVAEPLLDKFVAGLQQIQEGTAPEEFDSLLLERFERIGWVVGRKRLRRLTFVRNGHRVTVGQTFSSQVKQIIGEDELAAGSIAGMLEQINIHGGANVFCIYPIIGTREVRCHFPPEQMKKAVMGLGRYVGTSGQLRYKKRDKFPNAIDVVDMEIYPDEKELPTLSALRGIAKNATGNLSSEAFVRQLRNARK